VLDTPEVSKEERAAAGRALQSREPSNGSMAAVILDSTSFDSRIALAAGVAVTLVLYAGLAFAALNWAEMEPPRLETPQMEAYEVQHIVDLEEPEVVEESPAREPEPAPEPEPQRLAEPATEPEPAEAAPAEAAPSPAQAGQVVAASEEVADFADFTITTGSGKTYAGGVTASEGESKRAVKNKNARLDGVSDSSGDGPPCKPRPAGITQSDWKCPWPARADALSIDEETVVLQAVVRADGSAKSVAVLSDPGHGFGERARECAEKHEFTPARDESCQTYTATTPRINVRFTR